MSRNDAAFPGEILPAPAVHQGGSSYIGYPGLTKRELFAAMAMQGLCSNPAVDEDAKKIGNRADLHRRLAQSAVEKADYLIAELAK